MVEATLAAVIKVPLRLFMLTFIVYAGICAISMYQESVIKALYGGSSKHELITITYGG